MERACEYMAGHFTERIYLDQICRHAGLSKSTLLRAFTKEKDVTPYRYLETIRINEAKKLLSEGGGLPVEAAIRTDFSDQSHFPNYFNQFDCYLRYKKEGQQINREHGTVEIKTADGSERTVFAIGKGSKVHEGSAYSTSTAPKPFLTQLGDGRLCCSVAVHFFDA